MMDYGFGDVYDCRNVPEVGHFIVIIGSRETKDKVYVFYEKVTSRIYKAFEKLSKFFEDNCNGKCNKFKHNFKDKKPVLNYGKLCFTLFLDKNENYFDQDSMLVIKGDPNKTDAKILEKWIAEGLAKSHTRISNVDIYKLMAIINHSDNISKGVANDARTSFKEVDRLIKDQVRQKEQKKTNNGSRGK